MNKEISVIIPAYNCEQDFLYRALRSLESQTLDKSIFEVVIIDDGSDKKVYINSNDFSFQINVIRHEENYGLPSALNTALRYNKSRYFVRIDSDDYVHKDFLYVLYLKFKCDPKTFACAVDYKILNELEDVNQFCCFKDKPIGCGIMFRTEVLKTIGMYNESFLMAEDEEFLNRLSSFYKVHYLHLPLYYYVKHENNMTNNKDLYDQFRKKLK